MLKKFFLFFWVLIFSSVGIHAQEPASVLIDGNVVMRIYDTDDESGDLTAKAASDKINAKIDGGASGKDLTLKDVPEGTAIYWKDTLIIVVTKKQALKQNSESKALATLWLKNILAVVGEDTLKVSKRLLNIAVGEEETISVGSSGALKLKYDSSRLRVSVSEEDNSISFSPLSTGDFSVIIQRGTARCIVKVFAKERAGVISPSIEQTVTGNPAAQELIQSAVMMRVWDAVTINKGAELYIKEPPVIPKDLRPGEKMTVSVPVVIDGENYYRAEGTVRVTIVNSNVPWIPAKELWVSNRPETVKDDGVLFKDVIAKDESARMLYSHKNGSPDRRKLMITVKNKGRQNMRLLFRKASAGPDKFEMYAGHKAAVRYISLYSSKSGFILDLAPGALAEVENTDIPKNFLLSGFCDFQVLEGTEAEVRVQNHTLPRRVEILPDINEPFDPFKIHPHGVFPQAEIVFDRSYKLSSGVVEEIEVGKWPWVIDSETGEPNTGNYGVIYKLNVKLKNDTNSRDSVKISFVPLNGTSQGTIFMNGELCETPVVRKEEFFELKRISLEPGETKELQMITIPEASSCYPVKFVFDRGL